MRMLRVFLILIICISTVMLSSCGSMNSLSVNNTELKVGVEGINGVFNPFYAETEADKQITAQTVTPIQRVATDNSLVNHGGGISYEFAGGDKVKYTVSIKNDMKFSDGSNITIDDVIFFYHFIADATYDGTYKDWYLNNIEGLREYYFDDKNYQSSISAIEKKVAENYTLSTISTEDYTYYLAETKLEGKFNGDINSSRTAGMTWKEYITKLGYSEAYEDLGKKPTEEKIVRLVATVEAENNPRAYNPESWYRNKLYKEYIDKNYSDGIDVTEISGIKKINDYTCTVIFNSKNINAVSQLNALLVSKNFFAVEYVKGSAEKVKEISGISAVCSGPYILSEFKNDKVTAVSNKYYSDAECEFNRLVFVETPSEDAVADVVSGKIDVVSVEASSTVLNSFANKSVNYFITNQKSYVSAFFNTRSLEVSARMALMGIFSVNDILEKEIGSYYTKLLNPISIRFSEYPSNITNAYYSESSFTAYKMVTDNFVKEVTAYSCAGEDSLELKILNRYKEILAENGITMNIVNTSESAMRNAIVSGKADIWIDTVYDGATCDKYEYFNSFGKMNYTALSSAEIDEMTTKIRSSIGFSDKAQMTEKLMKLVMEEAVEYPLYQLQTVTVYNTDTIKAESLDGFDNYDGFTYVIPYLEEK